MGTSKYSVKEIFLLVCLAAFAGLSLFFFLNYKSSVFPEYNIDLKINRDQAQIQAVRKAQEFAVSIQGYEKATIFDMDDQVKTYLERNVGVKQTGVLAANDVDVWHFSTRFFQPLEKKEYTFSFLPNGRFVGFSSLIEETDPGSRLTKEQALVVAEMFLSEKISVDKNLWSLTVSDTKDLPDRVDHTFTWEKRNFKAADAPYRLQVQVFGDKVGAYQEFLKIPDNWLRQFDEERSRNELAQVVAEVASYSLFGIAILYTFIVGFRHRNLRLRFAAKVGLSVAVVAFLADINQFPLILYSFPTTQSYPAFIAEVIFGSLAGSLFLGLLVFLTVSVGEMVYRSLFPQHISLEKIFPAGIMTKTINQALLVGFFTGLIFLAYVTIYYIFGQSIGYWVPADANYSDIFNTYIPWIFPLLVGFSAAILEEGIFRLFGITFIKKYINNNFVAVLITSVMWAFLHSSYPQSPWFARGVEISLVGMVLGFLYLRFGIIASIAAHFTFNALQTAIFFYSSHSSYINLTSTLVAVLPLMLAILGLAYYFKKVGFLSQKGLLNTDLLNENPPTKGDYLVAPVQELHYKGMSAVRWVMLIILALVLTVAAVGVSLKLPENSHEQVILRESAVQKARAVFTPNVTSDYKAVAMSDSQTVNPLLKKYILEKADYKEFNKIFPSQIPLNFWSVRLFKPMQKNEYIARLLPDGTLYSTGLVLDENEPGVNLSIEEAVVLAQQYLTQRGEGDKYILVENQTDKKENRTDHFLTFDVQDKNIDQAKMRINLDILGDKPFGFEKYIKLPEDWVRANSETTFKDIAVGIVLTMLIGGVVVLSILNFLTFFRDKQIDFKNAWKATLAIGVIFLLSQINSLPLFYAGYTTSVPLQTFEIQTLLFIVFSFIFSLLGIYLLTGTFIALWQKYIGSIWPSDHQNRYLKDAILGAYLTPFIVISLVALIEYLLMTLNWSEALSDLSLNFGFDHLFPAFVAVSQVQTAFVGFMLVSVAILTAFGLLKTWFRVIVFGIFIVLLSTVSQSSNVNEYIKSVAITTLSFCMLLFVISQILRKNLLAYLLTLYITVLGSFSMLLLIQQETFYGVNGLVLLGLMFLPLLVYILHRIKMRKSSSRR